MIPQLHSVLHLLESGFAQLRILVVGDLMLDRYILGEGRAHLARGSRPRSPPRTALRAARRRGQCRHEPRRPRLPRRFWPASGARMGERNELASPARASQCRHHRRRHQFAAYYLEDPHRRPHPAAPAPRCRKPKRSARRRTLPPRSPRHRARYQGPRCHPLRLRQGRAHHGDVHRHSSRRPQCQRARPCRPKDPATSASTPAPPPSAPNLQELAQATGVPAQDTERLLAAARAQMLEHDFRFLTVTMSEKGIRILSRDPAANGQPEPDFYSPARAPRGL